MAIIRKTADISGKDLSKMDGVTLYKSRVGEGGAWVTRLRQDTVVNEGEKPTRAGYFVAQHTVPFEGDRANKHYVYDSGELSRLFTLAGATDTVETLSGELRV